jgi:hypothetical protein
LPKEYITIGDDFSLLNEGSLISCDAKEFSWPYAPETGLNNPELCIAMKLCFHLIKI